MDQTYLQDRENFHSLVELAIFEESVNQSL